MAIRKKLIMSAPNLPEQVVLNAMCACVFRSTFLLKDSDITATRTKELPSHRVALMSDAD